MLADLPSFTAMAVSFARAVVSLDQASPAAGLDPVAVRLLPRPVGAVVKGVEWGARISPLTLRGVRLLSLGVIDHCELRSLAIDAVVRAALHESRQLVVLGAGLDARAWRLPEAAGARVFEVDHPSTQRYKRARAGGAEADVRFVSVDFERDSLDERLAAAGHDPGAPSVWIWEGVTMYLPRAATVATLDVVRRRSSPGSTLAVTYVTPEIWNLAPAFIPLILRTFHLGGEPLQGTMSREEMGAALDDAGFERVADDGVADWGRRFRPERSVRVRLAERLAVARRRAS
ncbi:MAG TPA: class I SAM-dependent methyltransferase [Polyangiaceae bacterium]